MIRIFTLLIHLLADLDPPSLLPNLYLTDIYLFRYPSLDSLITFTSYQFHDKTELSTALSTHYHLKQHYKHSTIPNN